MSCGWVRQAKEELVGEQVGPVINARRSGEVFADDRAPLREEFTLAEADGVILERLPTDQQGVRVLLLDTLRQGEADESVGLAQHLGDGALHSSLEGGVIFRCNVDNSNLVNHVDSLTSQQRYEGAQGLAAMADGILLGG